MSRWTLSCPIRKVTLGCREDLGGSHGHQASVASWAGDHGSGTSGTFVGKCCQSVSSCSPVWSTPVHAVLMSAGQEQLPMSHMPALPAGYMTVLQLPPYLPEVSCHTPEVGTCFTQQAHSVLRGSAWASVLCPLPALWTQGGLCSGAVCHQLNACSPAFNPKLFVRIHLLPVLLVQMGFPGLFKRAWAWPVAGVCHVPELCPPIPCLCLSLETESLPFCVNMSLYMFVLFS